MNIIKKLMGLFTNMGFLKDLLNTDIPEDIQD